MWRFTSPELLGALYNICVDSTIINMFATCLLCMSRCCLNYAWRLIWGAFGPVSYTWGVPLIRRGCFCDKFRHLCKMMHGKMGRLGPSYGIELWLCKWLDPLFWINHQLVADRCSASLYFVVADWCTALLGRNWHYIKFANVFLSLFFTGSVTPWQRLRVFGMSQTIILTFL